MQVDNVLTALSTQYPHCPIFRVPNDNPTEIVCETSRTDWPNQSVAVAIIDRSLPHVHRKTTEVYIIEKGELTVYINGRPVVLHEHDVLIVQPNQVHWAEGRGSRVKVIASPAWTPEDHILVDLSAPEPTS